MGLTESKRPILMQLRQLQVDEETGLHSAQSNLDPA